jgi:putative transcriptional regulator
MTKQYRSPVMASIHETAEGLHAAGVMDKQDGRSGRIASTDWANT